MEIYTIGHPKKSAEESFERLKLQGIRRAIDVRLNNTSQFAGFSKRDNLRYLLREVIVAVGLGRSYSPGARDAVNWLQVNNLFPRETPLWETVADLA